MFAIFCGIVAKVPNDLGIKEAVFLESRGGGAMVQRTAIDGIVHFATLSPLPEPTATRRRYTAAGMNEHAESLAGVWMCPGIQIKDLWAHADKNTAVMIH
ncbi:hypothetical protein DL769_010124 [Monosporascus sp. CRB-8-3]|nr:hypothetical protein DL769_010124 [Monosporascus sp. CRB-8-3]